MRIAACKAIAVTDPCVSRNCHSCGGRVLCGSACGSGITALPSHPSEVYDHQPANSPHTQTLPALKRPPTMKSSRRCQVSSQGGQLLLMGHLSVRRTV